MLVLVIKANRGESLVLLVLRPGRRLWWVVWGRCVCFLLTERTAFLVDSRIVVEVT